MKTLLFLTLNLCLSTNAFANLELDLDLDHKVSKYFNKDGGELQTVDSSGQKIILSIPAGALDANTEISLTPLKNVKGIAMDNGLKAGAHLEPDGLQLSKTSQLTIELNTPINPKASLPVHYRLAKNSYQAQAMFIKGNQIRFPIIHFSGYLGGEGSAPNWEAIRNQPMPNPAENLASDFAQIVKLNQEGFYKTEEEYQKAIDDLYSSVKNGPYNALLKQFGTGPNCGVEKNRMKNINTLLRQASILGLPDDWPRLESSLFERIHKRCTNELENACNERHDPALTQNILSLAREAALLGYNDLEHYSSEAAKRCGTFQIVIESRLDVAPKKKPVWDKFTSYHITNWPDELALAPGGESVPEEVVADGNFDYSQGMKNCKTTWNFVPDPMIFNQLKVEVASRYSEGSEDAPFDLPMVDIVDFTLRYMPGNIDEVTHSQCKGSPPFDLTTKYWYIYFLHFHEKEIASNYVWARNFKMQPIGGALIAEKNYDDSYPSNDSSTVFYQKTNIKIYHAPGAH